MQRFALYICFLCFACSSYAQETISIPDKNFRIAIASQGVDTTDSGEFTLEDLEDITVLNVINSQIDNLDGIEHFANLEELNCSFNNISELDLIENIKLRLIKCSRNQIETLSIDSLERLKELDVSVNQLKSIHISENDSIVKLNCSQNSLKELSVLECDSLQELNVSGNELNSIILDNNHKLKKLNCSDNLLSSLSIDSNPLLREVKCSNNNITRLDFDNHLNLKYLFCNSNNIEQLNLRKADSLEFLNCSENKLEAINLKERRFITNLHVSGNKLKELNVAHIDSLEFLSCSENFIDSLNTKSNAVLSKLICNANRITGKLNLSNNDSLQTLNCSDNRLHAINIQNGFNEELMTFDCTENPFLACIQVDDENQIGEDWEKDEGAAYCSDCKFEFTVLNDRAFEQALIDLKLDTILDYFVRTSHIDTVKSLILDNLQIFDLTGIEDFANLEVLDCSYNVLKHLDMTHNRNLHTLECDSNNMEYLNVQTLYGLEYLNCTGNKLNHLDLADNLQLTKLFATDNSFLDCIEVLDPEAAMIPRDQYKDWEVDDKNVFSGNCHSNDTRIPDIAFEQALIDLKLDTISDHFVRTSHIDTVRSLIIDSLMIFDLTGIEDFKALEVLDCTGNYLDSILLDSQRNLKTLKCANNQLAELNLDSLKQLDTLDCSNNLLTVLKTDSCELLKALVCDQNPLDSLNLDRNKELSLLSCNSNQLTSGRFSYDQCTELQELYCSSNQLTDLDVRADSLTILVCMNNQIENLDLKSHKYLEHLDCSFNQLTELFVDSCEALQALSCNSNKLSKLIFGSKRYLVSLECKGNQLSSIDLATLVNLRHLNCSMNQLETLELAENTELLGLKCSHNRLKPFSLESQTQLELLDVSNNMLTSEFVFPEALVGLNCSYNGLNKLDVSTLDSLMWLICDSTEIDTLALGGNPVLDSLSCSHNALRILDIGGNDSLRCLHLTHNNIQSLNTDSATLLQKLYCSNNRIDTLRLQNNKKLTTVDISFNRLKAVDIANGANQNIELFSASGNPDLNCIQVDENTPGRIASGTYSNWFPDSATYNAKCHYCETYIPDKAFEQALIAMKIDSGDPDSYVFNDSIAHITSLDVSNKQIDDLTGIEGFIMLYTLIVSNNEIDSLDLQSNTFLKVLQCDTNKLKWLNVDDLEELTTVDCRSNELNALFFNTNIFIESINCSDNELEALNIKNGYSKFINYLDANNNSDLTCIEVDQDMIGNIPDTWFYNPDSAFNPDCHYYQTFIPDENFELALISRDLDSGEVNQYVYDDSIRDVAELNVDEWNIYDMTGIEGFTSLQNLSCSQNMLSELVLNTHDSIEILDISYNRINQIDLSHLKSLRELTVAGNMLSEVNLLSNKEIEVFDCSSNSLTEIDLSGHTAIRELKASKNSLDTVDLRNQNNALIKSLDLRSNSDLRCILVDNIENALSYSGWYKDETAHYKYFCDDDDNDGVKNEDDQCPDTPFGDIVDFIGCSAYFLPADYFSITVSDETCQNKNDGSILVLAKESENYVVSLNKEQLQKELYFTDTLYVKNLASGLYGFCIALEENPDAKQCFTLLVKEPEVLGVSAYRMEEKGYVSYDLQGAKEYILDHNGDQRTITGDRVQIRLVQGANRISISTLNDCQGKFKDIIYHSDNLVVYPNPFIDKLNVHFDYSEEESVNVTIASMEGQVVYLMEDVPTDSSLELDTKFLADGVYVLTVTGNSHRSSIKIIK